MPILVHLADEKEAASIKRNGLKIGKHRQGIFCMPVMPNYYVSHQWLRELKRRGVRTFVGVYFKLPSDTKVFAGKYNEGHKNITLGAAIKEIQSMEDPLGYEIIVDKKIAAKEIEKIKGLPQNLGWRYMPHAKGRRPCPCDYCVKSAIKANKIRERLGQAEPSLSYTEILKRLKKEEDIDEIGHLLDHVRSKRRRANPTELLFLLDKNEVEIDQSLAIALKMFRHKETRSMLFQLLEKADDDTREFAADSLLELYGQEVVTILEEKNDPAIEIALEDWKGTYA